MSLLIKNCHPNRVLQLSRVVNLIQTKQSHWLPDFRPGPYPKTQEEREAAAKKYHLLPIEYEPYPDDGDGIGDYPKLPLDSVDSRDPYHNWDNPQFRRDYLEPVCWEIMSLTPETRSTGPTDMTPAKGMALFLGAVSVTALILSFFTLWKLEVPVSEKQYPINGPHYTFELTKKSKR